MRSAWLWMGLVAGCGGDGAISTGGSTGAATSAGDSSDTAPEDPAEHDNCEASGNGSNELDHPNTAHFTDLLQQAIDSHGYGDHVVIERSATVEGSPTPRFCATLILRVDWFAEDAYSCWDHGTDEQITAHFEDTIATWPPLPLSIVPLEVVEARVTECNAELLRPYEPCDSDGNLALTLSYGTSEWVDDCHQQFETATVDLVTGQLTRCESEMGPDNCRGEG